MFMGKGKRFQKHNRVALPEVPAEAGLRDKEPTRHYQVGLRYRKSGFFPLSNSK